MSSSDAAGSSEYERACAEADAFMKEQGWVTRQNVTHAMMTIHRREFRSYMAFYRDYTDAPRNRIARARMETFNELVLLARLKGEL